MSATRIVVRTTKKGDRRFIVYYRRGGRGWPEEYAGSFKTKREAQMRRDVIAGELAAGRDPKLLLESLQTPPPRAATLSQRWDEFVAAQINVGEKTHEQYRSARRAWLPILGAGIDPHTITPQTVIDAITALRETKAPATIASYLGVLKKVLDHADVEPNPARSPKVKAPRKVHVETEIPGHAAWHAIRDAVWARSRLALELEQACAFRVSEACLLELGDIDFIEGMVRIRRAATKTAAGRRWVPVPRELLDRLEEHLPPLEDRRADARVLRVTADEVYADLVRACKDAGVPRFGTHALRHRRISLLIRHGIDPVQVAYWSGHSRPSESLDTYGHQVIDPRGDEWRRFWLDAYAGVKREQVL